jgi:integrase
MFAVRTNGQRIRRSGFLSRAEAQEALDALKHPIPVVAVAATGAGMTLAEGVERYLKVKARKRGIVDDRRITGRLMVALGADTPLVNITPSVIAEYRAQRLAVKRGEAFLSPAAINRPLGVLRHLLKLAHEEWEVLPSAPRTIRMEKERQGRCRWLTPEEAHRFFTACRALNALLSDLVEFCAYTGLRQAEALELTWGRVDRARGVVLLELTKNGRRREVPLCGPADATLARRQAPGGDDDRVFGANSWYAFRRTWRRAVRATGLADFHFHDLRHTFASWAVQRGATLPELKDLLGHSSLAMVLRYAHLAPEHLRSAVSRLDDVMARPQGAAEMATWPVDSRKSAPVLEAGG